MSIEDLKAVSADFAALCDNPPAGYRISKRVLDPVLIISRQGQAYCARVGGRQVSGGQEQLLPALSNKHNWVSHEEAILPLPSDVGVFFQQVMAGRDADFLSFSDVLHLVREEKKDLPIAKEPGAFAPAKESAGELEGELAVRGLKGDLYPYQARGVQWMQSALDVSGGVILADEMGLGKTIQIISLLLLDPPETDAPALIVCPTTLISNWVREIGKFAPGLSVLVHRGPRRGGIYRYLQEQQIVIVTYDTLVNDISIFSAFEWSYVVCDEAQAIKNPDSKRRQAVDRVPRRRCIPMTGTPVENSLVDLWSLTDFAIPGLLGSREDFELRFPDEEQSARVLNEITDPIVLRRRVSDVANDLPDRIDIDLPLELGEDLAVHYRRIRQETLRRYPIGGALVATGQLQIFCAHPWLRTELTGSADWEDSVELEQLPDVSILTPKLERTVELLREAFDNDRKVLIFAVFNGCAELICKVCRGFPDHYWGTVNGATPQEDRQGIVDEFSAHEGPGVLVLNPRAAGTGLNITAATVVIHYTPVWNPAVEVQASARAHRIGQDQPVTVYRLFYEQTVEEVMIERSAWKRELGNEAVPVGFREDTDLARALEIEPETEDDRV